VSGFEVRGGVEAGEVRHAGGRDRRLLVGPPAAHLDHPATVGHVDHAGGGRRDGRVVVEDGEHQRLEQHRLAERALDGQHRRSREVELALPVGDDVAPEAVAGQEVERPPVDEVLPVEEGELLGGEAERLDLVEQPTEAADHAVASTVGQLAPEHLEHGPQPRRAVAQCRREHRQLVVVRLQRTAGFHGSPTPPGFLGSNNTQDEY
jgi:hypothetical protein